MRTRTILLIIILTCLTGKISSVHAQGVHLIEIEIPFQFVLNGRTLPAGKYAVERIDPARPNVLMLKNINRGIVRLVLVQRVEKESPSAGSDLIFCRREGKSYLFQVWTIGDKNGNQIPSDNNNRRDQPDKNSTLVRLRAKSP